MPKLPSPRGLILGFAILAAAGSCWASGNAALAQVATPQSAPDAAPPEPTPGAAPGISRLPPAQFDPALAIGGSDVKARKIETRLTVDVHINGRGPYPFIVDSGADSSAVGLGLARQLALPVGAPVILNGMTGTSLVDRVKIDALTLGSTTIANLQLPALREIDMGAQGIIGIDALARQRLLMDFDKHVIKVEDARTKERTFPGDIVIVARRHRGQLILAEVRASSQQLDAIIDTGSQLTVGNLALRDKLKLKRRATFRTLEMIGVTGEKLSVDLAIVDELELGPVVLRNVPMAFADLPPFKLLGLADEPALLLGTDILENFRRVSLDFRLRKVRFQLRRCTTQGIIISTSTENVSRLSARDARTCSK